MEMPVISESRRSSLGVGKRFPFSQCPHVADATPNRRAASRCENEAATRHFFSRCAKVREEGCMGLFHWRTSPVTDPACFWHPSLLRRRNARSAEGTGFGGLAR